MFAKINVFDDFSEKHRCFFIDVSNKYFFCNHSYLFISNVFFCKKKTICRRESRKLLCDGRKWAVQLCYIRVPTHRWSESTRKHLWNLFESFIGVSFPLFSERAHLHCNLNLVCLKSKIFFQIATKLSNEHMHTHTCYAFMWKQAYSYVHMNAKCRQLLFLY